VHTIFSAIHTADLIYEEYNTSKYIYLIDDENIEPSSKYQTFISYLEEDLRRALLTHGLKLEEGIPLIVIVGYALVLLEAEDKESRLMMWDMVDADDSEYSWMLWTEYFTPLKLGDLYNTVRHVDEDIWLSIVHKLRSTQEEELEVGRAEHIEPYRKRLLRYLNTHPVQLAKEHLSTGGITGLEYSVYLHLYVDDLSGMGTTELIHEAIGLSKLCDDGFETVKVKLLKWVKSSLHDNKELQKLLMAVQKLEESDFE
jgi:hypothetical protein